MRGGRGGKGRGRGGRGSVTQDLLRDNLEDLGIENPNNFSNQAAPPLLYPPISLQAPCAVQEQDLFFIQKMREIKQRFQSSPYFLTRKNNDKDIERYSDKYRSNTKDIGLLNCINASKDDISRYIPLELLGGSTLGTRDGNMNNLGGGDDITKLQRKRKQDLDLIKLEQQESAGSKKVRRDDEESDGEAENEEEDEEIEMDDDYGVDHYASDDGFGGSDDDGEAIF